MSYCRFSSDNWQSDVYAYESIEGFTVHVATYHLDRPVSCLNKTFDDPGFAQSYTQQLEEVKAMTRHKIGLPYDDKTIIVDTLEELLDQLLMLRETGYHIPESALEMIKIEIEEG